MPKLATPFSKQTAKTRTTQNAGGKPVGRSSAGKTAVVLARIATADGKFYQVLAPAAGPRHLSIEDIRQAVEFMVSTRTHGPGDAPQ